MKTSLFVNTMTMNGSRHDFPRLARESGFSFNLFRGRVDWNKIGSIDVDRLIRERDLETLQDAVLSIMSCSLDNEYDLKVLDPNFVKLFRLAQLSVEYLQYCRNYLDHCITAMQDQLRVALQDIEQLQKDQLQKDQIIHQLQKKYKSKVRSPTLQRGSPLPIFKCPSCMKVFVAEKYLIAHQMRRHSEMSGLTNNKQIQELEAMMEQVQQLQERLLTAEDILKKYNPNHPISEIFLSSSNLPSSKEKVTDSSSPLGKSNGAPDGASLTMDQTNIGIQACECKSDAQVQTSESTFPNIMQSIEQINTEYQADRAALLDCVQQQNNEIKTLRDQLFVQHQSHEAVFQKKLESLQKQHQVDLAELRSSLLPPSAGSGAAITIPPHVPPRQPATHQKLKAWERSEDTVDLLVSAAIKSQPQGDQKAPVNSRKSSSSEENSSSEVSPVKLLSSGDTVLVPRSSHPSKTSIEVQQCEDNSSSSHVSLLSPIQDNVQNVPKISSSKVSPSSPRDKVTHSKTIPSSTQSSSRAEVKSGLMYEEATSSASSESVSGSGSSSYDSDTRSTPSESQPEISNVTKSLSRVELRPQLLAGLKEDLQVLLDNRLRELGVDPEWNRLPAASFLSNMATIKHHQNIAAKTHKSYFNIREAILLEVDERIAERAKQSQRPAESSSSLKKKSHSGSSPSLLARIKSSVKTKLSTSGRSSQASKLNLKAITSFKKSSSGENVYSGEPSHGKTGTRHGYESLPEKSILKEASSNLSVDVNQQSYLQNQTQIVDDGLSFDSNDNQLAASKETSSAGTSVLSEGKPIDLSPCRNTQPVKVTKSYGRSMYANLGQADIERENERTPTWSTNKQHQHMKTSTPVKAVNSSSSVEDKVNLVSKSVPSLIPSDMESISELESDANDIEGKGHKTPYHVTPSTAELLADVARLRQTTGHLTVKSNLKSSQSTGSLMKKKVVFRDEKDGFATIELGPVHGSSAPQRSHSDSDLSSSLSSELPAPAPIPLPRGSHASSFPQPSWDGFDSIRKPIEPRPGKRVRSPAFGANSRETATQSWKGGGSAVSDCSRVSGIIQDIEKKLQLQNRKPLFGINTARSPTSPSEQINIASVNSASESQSLASSTRIENTSRLSMAPGLQSEKTSVDSLISDLLLDDLSSSG